MNYGPLLFLAAFFALATSWFGFVLIPQAQLGNLQQTNAVPTGATYPLGRPGAAREGLDVYRANGCAACHSQQLVQSGTTCDVVLSEPGTNRAAVVQALRQVRSGWSEAEAQEFLSGLPRPVLRGLSKGAADAAAKALAVGGAKAQVWILPTGPDMARGWGKRRTVAYDFVFDDPVMPGAQRIGPDLADVGARLPDRNWQLLHLYAPRAAVQGSAMPAYRFLFEKRRIETTASPDALALPRELQPEPGFEILPKMEAKALVAYLLSLRVDEPLFVAPLSVAAAPQTNAPAGSANATNAVSTNAPAK